MATLKEHQAAMVGLLANGSGIPASASRLAHAMHDALSAILAEPDLMAKAIAESKAIRNAFTTPGLNDKALSKREKALKTDSPAKWPTPAEQRVKELENTVKQLKANLVKVRAENDVLNRENARLENALVWHENRQMPEQACVAELRHEVSKLKYELGEANRKFYEPEQAGCRKGDTQCRHEGNVGHELGNYGRVNE
ncbi:MAG: hypothetical protein ACRCZ6_15110 [Kluyvera sp.]|uniref:hypothetical protein n=1 Tax=Kluyvera sp. TaxID=1538228 RepID=UPI003F3FB1AB